MRSFVGRLGDLQRMLLFVQKEYLSNEAAGIDKEKRESCHIRA